MEKFFITVGFISTILFILIFIWFLWDLFVEYLISRKEDTIKQLEQELWEVRNKLYKAEYDLEYAKKGVINEK